MDYKNYSYMTVYFITNKRFCMKYKVNSYMTIHFTYNHSILSKQAARAIDTEFTENMRSVTCL